MSLCCTCLHSDKFCRLPEQNFRVQLKTDQLVPSHYTEFTQVLFDNIVSNSLCTSTFAESVLTILRGGTYAITASVFWSDNPANTRQVIVRIIDKDDVEQSSFSSTTNVFGFQDSTTASATLYIPAKSKISVYARQVSGVSIQALNSPSTFFEVNLIK